MNVENGMRVYFDGDSEWYASPWDLETTKQWLIEQYQLNEDFEIEECDLDNDCMWYETDNKEDIEALGKYNKVCNGRIGDLRRSINNDNEVEKLVSFREVLKLQGNNKEPYEIATTN